MIILFTVNVDRHELRQTTAAAGSTIAWPRIVSFADAGNVDEGFSEARQGARKNTLL